jgi:hypothetical protein
MENAHGKLTIAEKDVLQRRVTWQSICQQLSDMA